MVGADDFTIRAGSGDAAIHDKQIFVERHAREMRMPVVRLLDGASGGGSVKIAQEEGYHYLPVNPGWDAVVDLLSLTPIVAAALGPTVDSVRPGLSCRTSPSWLIRLALSSLPGLRSCVARPARTWTKISWAAQLFTAKAASSTGSSATEAEAYDVVRAFLSVPAVERVRDCRP